MAMANNLKDKNIKIPVTKSDITPSWVNQVTGHLVSLIPEDFIVEGDIQAGIGFMSSICRVSYKTTDGKKHSIIIKLLPDSDNEWLEFALADASDEREIKFYADILPDLLQVIPEIEENLCEFYGASVKPADPSTGTKKASMLIIDDLKARGFRMMSFSGETSDYALGTLVTFMARLHYGAFAIEQKKGIPLPKLYPFMQGISENPEWMNQVESLCNEGYAALKELFSSHNVSDETWKKYELLKPYTEEMAKKITDSGKKYPCLIHGDVWPPNIQVHEDNKVPVKVLDWQLMGYRDVTYDLSIMLYTVLPKEMLTMDKLTELLRKYYEEFEKLCKDGGLQDKIKRRSWEEFKEFFFTWGASFAYLVMLPSISCYNKDLPKYANVFRFWCEENKLPQFLLKECIKDN